MTDEHVVLNGDAFANKAMAGDLAVLPDGCVLLDFNKGSDFRVLSDLAAVKVDEFRKLNPASQFHIWSNRAEFVHSHTNSPSICREQSAKRCFSKKADIYWIVGVAVHHLGKLPPLTTLVDIPDSSVM